MAWRKLQLFTEQAVKIAMDQNARSGRLGYKSIVNLEVFNEKETTVKVLLAGQWQTGASEHCP